MPEVKQFLNRSLACRVFAYRCLLKKRTTSCVDSPPNFEYWRNLLWCLTCALCCLAWPRNFAPITWRVRALYDWLAPSQTCCSSCGTSRCERGGGGVREAGLGHITRVYARCVTCSQARTRVHMWYGTCSQAYTWIYTRYILCNAWLNAHDQPATRVRALCWVAWGGCPRRPLLFTTASH